jgi:hypothetical protein
MIVTIYNRDTDKYISVFIKELSKLRNSIEYNEYVDISSKSLINSLKLKGKKLSKKAINRYPIKLVYDKVHKILTVKCIEHGSEIYDVESHCKYCTLANLVAEFLETSDYPILLQLRYYFNKLLSRYLK